MPKAMVNGTELNYRDAGTAKDVVLFLHAFPLHSGMWARQLAALEKRHRVVALDYRGLGKSGMPPEASPMDLLAQDVRALLQHLRIERAAVVAMSMGGYLAFELYRELPGLFRGIVLCDTKAGADTDEGKATREKFAQTALEKGLGWVADEMMPKLLRPEPDPAVVKEVRSLITGSTPAGVAAAQRGMARRPDSTPTLATITCPALVIVGAEDALTPPAESEKLAAGVKGAKLVVIPGAGHLSNLDAPDAFNRALSAFVDPLPA
ncbi:MAG TPA: alpha/beta fold hydrolase [Anaeromyxobacter sp.]